LQHTQINNVLDEIKKKDLLIKETCIEACKNSYRAFLNKNRIEDEEEDSKKKGHLIGDNSNRRMEFTQLAAKSTHYLRLMKFIKLCDLLITRCNLGMAIDTLRKVKESLTFTEEKYKQSRNKKK